MGRKVIFSHLDASTLFCKYTVYYDMMIHRHDYCVHFWWINLLWLYSPCFSYSASHSVFHINKPRKRDKDWFRKHKIISIDKNNNVYTQYNYKNKIKLSFANLHHLQKIPEWLEISAFASLFSLQMHLNTFLYIFYPIIHKYCHKMR